MRLIQRIFFFVLLSKSLFILTFRSGIKSVTPKEFRRGVGRKRRRASLFDASRRRDQQVYTVSTESLENYEYEENASVIHTGGLTKRSKLCKSNYTVSTGCLIKSKRYGCNLDSKVIFILTTKAVQALVKLICFSLTLSLIDSICPTLPKANTSSVKTVKPWLSCIKVSVV